MLPIQKGRQEGGKYLQKDQEANLGETTYTEENFWEDFVLYKSVRIKQQWDDNIHIPELRKQNYELETVKNETDTLKI